MDCPGWVNNIEAAGWDGVIVSSFVRDPFYQGRSIQEIADELGIEPADAYSRVLVEEEGRPTTILKMMHEDDVRTLISDPLVMIGSDTASRAGDRIRACGAPIRVCSATTLETYGCSRCRRPFAR